LNEECGQIRPGLLRATKKDVINMTHPKKSYQKKTEFAKYFVEKESDK